MYNSGLMKLAEKRVQADLLAGGVGDKSKLTDFKPNQVRLGLKEEKEHTSNPAIAAEITKDHLAEDSNYYTKLQKLAYGTGEHVGPYEADRAADVAGADDVIAGARKNMNEHPAHALLNPFVTGPLTELLARVYRRNTAGRGTNMTNAVVGTTLNSGLPSSLALGYAGVPEYASPAALASSLGYSAAAGGAKARHEGRRRYETSALRETQDELEEKDRQELLNKKSAVPTAEELADETGEIGPYRTAQGARLSEQDRRIAANVYNRRNNLAHYLLNPFVRGPLFEGLDRLDRRVTASKGTSTPMAVAGSIPGVNLLAYPYLAYEGGTERQMALRDAFRGSPGVQKAKNREEKAELRHYNKYNHQADDNVKTSAYLGQLAAQRSYLNR